MDKLFPLFNIPVPFFPELTEKFQLASGIMLFICILYFFIFSNAPSKVQLVQKYGEERGEEMHKAGLDITNKVLSLGLLLFLTGWIAGIPFLLYQGFRAVKLLLSGSAEKATSPSSNSVP